MTTLSTIDPGKLRVALSFFPTGVAVVTTLGEADEPVGLTISSFNSVSLEPPLILWTLALSSRSLSAFRRRGAFAVNVLAADGEELAKRFATAADDRFKGLGWTAGIAGVPVLSDAAATFECRTYAIHPGGDHEIFLGEVVRYDHGDATPLVFGRGRYAPLG